MATNANTTYLYLVRHGATAANEKRPYVLQGCGSDLPLSFAGRQQAADVARYLARFPIEHVYSSPLGRAVQTATAIADALQLTIATEPSLVECDIGQWEGLSWGAIAERYPCEYARFTHDAAHHPYLGGETLTEVLERTHPVFQRILRTHPGRHIAVVAHAVVNRVFLTKLLGVNVRHARRVPQHNGCVNLITGTGGKARLVTVNSIHHLDLKAA